MGRVQSFASFAIITDIEISPASWKAINQAGNIIISEEMRTSIKEHLIIYANAKVRHKQAPTAQQVLGPLVDVHDAGIAFMNALDRLERPGTADLNAARRSKRTTGESVDDEEGGKLHASLAVQLASASIHKALRYLAKSGGRSFGDPPMAGEQLVDARAWEKRLYNEVGAWTQAAALSQEKIKLQYGKSSAPPDRPLHDFLVFIAPVYKCAGGSIAANKDPWSPFLRWLDALLSCLPEDCDRKSISSLCSAVQRMLTSEELPR